MNKSGVRPRGDRVLVKPDVIDETVGGIIIPDEYKEKHQAAQMAGVLVDVGPDAWFHSTTTVEMKMDNGEWKETERKRSGYSEPFAQVGDRVCFAQWNGRNFDGEDGEQYRLLNDEDITATVSDGVDFTEMRRDPLGAQG